MKARTKIQKRVLQLSQTLPSISAKQEEWAFRHCIMVTGRRTKKSIACLHCGHVWNDSGLHDQTVKSCQCPQCGEGLRLADSRKQRFNEDRYMCLITTCGGFQVLRFFSITAYMRVGERERRYCSEVVQRWIGLDGYTETIALRRSQFMAFSNCTWIIPVS